MGEERREAKNEVVQREEEILAFWNKKQIFKKSLEKDSPKGEFIFYDGPPFATGLPHYGHILAGTIKDAIPRYKTMRGYHVRRQWGWDCHGLPVENEVEKELHLTTKKDIENFGIAKFNEAARGAVLRYADDWKKIIPRLGRWAEMDRDYRTMDSMYTETVWWIFKTLYDKKLIYKGFKSMHLCPRCGTTLSNFEVNLGYKDVTDLAITVKLPLIDDPKTSLLVWTTTAWTLPGNMAAAVRRDAVYVKVAVDDEQVIIAKDRLSMLEGKYTVLEEFKGEKLIGKRYKPPFDYFRDVDIKGKENAWKVYHAPYVSTDEGTGIVHLAPAFGEEDLTLAQEKNIPIVHHVDQEGKFTEHVRDFAGLAVKPKENPQATDIEILKHLAHKNLLFKKEKVKHSYPFCWRCETPLLNYASDSWFVKVTALKDRLVAANKEVRWIPEDIRDGRFGKWLSGVRDWAISRSRFWGAPLPVWEDSAGRERIAIGSVEELKKHMKSSGNRYFVMRHGESESNIERVVSAQKDNPHALTSRGIEEARAQARNLKRKKIDLIISSPFVRTRQTAEVVAPILGHSSNQIIFDDRIAEINTGTFNGKKIDEYHAYFNNSYEEMFIKRPPEGENLLDLKKRVGEFIYDIDKKYSNKNILIITHEYPTWLVTAAAEGMQNSQTIAIKEGKDDFIKTGEVQELSFVPLPHNEQYELDLHRPYIDDIELVGSSGETLKRVPDVFDCWFESGSMPYGQFHYPFENRDVFNPEGKLFSRPKGFPADFIAEGVDQTRGWFYSLLVLSVALFNKAPYKSVIVNGTILAEDGQKMSKRLKNYPDPMDTVDRYGADAVRYYLLSSPSVRAEDFSFSEKGVEDVMKKIPRRLANVYAFYELYRQDEHVREEPRSDHIIDRWILSRLNQLMSEVTKGMESYKLDQATRPIALFVDDLSTWYVRRSRERFKGDDKNDKRQAREVLHFVLWQSAKVLAPFMPFYADYLYRLLRSESDPESVHLSNWPQAEGIDYLVLDDMKVVRTIVSRGLESRAQAGIKVRQPLAALKIKELNINVKANDALLKLIQDELNVKNVVFDESVEQSVVLDTEITDELREEGIIRELIRYIQDLRKKEKLSPRDRVELTISTSGAAEQLLKKYTDEIQRASYLSRINFARTEGTEVTIGPLSFTFRLSK